LGDEFLQLLVPCFFEEADRGRKNMLQLLQEIHSRLRLTRLEDSDETLELVFDDGDLDPQGDVLKDYRFRGALFQVALERGLVLVFVQPVFQGLAGGLLLFNPAGARDRNGRDLGDVSPRTTQIDHSDENLI